MPAPVTALYGTELGIAQFQEEYSSRVTPQASLCWCWLHQPYIRRAKSEQLHLLSLSER